MRRAKDAAHLVPPRSGDEIIWAGSTRKGVVPAVVVGLDMAGALRVQVRFYFVDPTGRMYPKAGVSFGALEFQRLAQRVLAVIGGFRLTATSTSMPARTGRTPNDPAV